MSRIAVLHDSFDAVGGAEYSAVTIARIFNSPIYTATKLTNAYDNEAEIIPLTMKRTNNYAIEKLSKARAFKKLKLEHDIIISSGNEVKFYEPQRGQYHVNYTYTPTRMFYDLKDVHKKRFSFTKSVVFELYSLYWQRSVQKALNNIDKFLCISEVIKERMKRYWCVNAQIIYLPIDISKYRCKPAEDYFLYISRLNSIKRIGIVLDAFKDLNENLVVVGKDEEGFYEKMSKMPNVHYRGELGMYDDEKLDLLARCKAVIYPPMAEDFGLVPIEAFASGKPVIGVKEGFTKYQINDKNGVFVNPTPEGIQEGVKKVKEMEWEPKEIRRYAEQFDIKVFERRLKEMVGNYE